MRIDNGPIRNTEGMKQLGNGDQSETGEGGAKRGIWSFPGYSQGACLSYDNISY